MIWCRFTDSAGWVYEAITAVSMQQRYIPVEPFSFCPFAQRYSLKYVLQFCVVKKDGLHHICVILHSFFNFSFVVTVLWRPTCVWLPLCCNPSRVTMCTSEKYFSLQLNQKWLKAHKCNPHLVELIVLKRHYILCFMWRSRLSLSQLALKMNSSTVPLTSAAQETCFANACSKCDRKSYAQMQIK